MWKPCNCGYKIDNSLLPDFYSSRKASVVTLNLLISGYQPSKDEDKWNSIQQYSSLSNLQEKEQESYFPSLGKISFNFAEGSKFYLHIHD